MCPYDIHDPQAFCIPGSSLLRSMIRIISIPLTLHSSPARFTIVVKPVFPVLVFTKFLLTSVLPTFGAIFLV